MNTLLTVESYWEPGIILAEDEIFNIKYYIECNPDVFEAGLDPFDHFIRHGAGELRSPNCWFDLKWYSERYFVFDDLVNSGISGAFSHYCKIGNVIGFPPNQLIHDMIEKLAFEFFDSVYYLDSYPDVESAKTDPWLHYLMFGWKEGRSPCRHFACDAYHTQVVLPAIDKKWHLLKFRYNPLFHFTIFKDEAWRKRLENTDFCIETSTSIAKNSAQKFIDYIKETIPIRNGGLQGKKNINDLQLVLASRFFNAQYYAVQAKKSGTREVLCSHYLNVGWKLGLDPSPEFDSQFYSIYSKIHDKFALEIDGTVANPLVHFLRYGQQKGFFSNTRQVSYEVEIIRTSGLFNPFFYIDNINRTLIQNDPVIDYVLFGHLEKQFIWNEVDENFIMEVYPIILNRQFHSPLGFYLKNRDKPWMFRSASELEQRIDELRKCASFEAYSYARNANIENSGVDPAAHYLLLGLLHGYVVSDDFDTEFYLDNNHDLAYAPVNPIIHFDSFGKGEGRIGVSHVKKTVVGCGKVYDSTKPTCLIVTHEASRTGAPIVALNLAKKLSSKYNVVTWIGKEAGVLADQFYEESIMALENWGSNSVMRYLLKDIKEKFKCSVSLINSVVSNPIISALVANGIARVSLIHEFASYVYPPGTTSRLATHSNVTVFPAEIVAQSFREEAARIGVCNRTPIVEVFPQGYNTSGEMIGDFTSEELLQIIGGGLSSRRLKVVLGAGQVTHRKGVDLFVQTAYHLIDEGKYDWRFIWVGGGYDPISDVNYSLYLSQQIRKCGLERHIIMIGEQKSLKAFWNIADVFLLSSRLDPFPNVAIDSIIENVPIVCFDESTGVSTFKERFGFAIRGVPYCDCPAAALAISELICERSKSKSDFYKHQYNSLVSELSFDSYVSRIEGLFDIAVDDNRLNLDICDRLSVLSEIDLRYYFGLISEYLRLCIMPDRATQISSIAAFLNKSPAVAFSVLSTVSEADVFSDRAPLEIGKCGGSFRFSPPTDENFVHLFCDDFDTYVRFMEGRSFPSSVISNCRVYVTASHRSIALAIYRRLDVNVIVINKQFSNSIFGLLYFFRNNGIYFDLNKREFSINWDSIKSVTNLDLCRKPRGVIHEFSHRTTFECLIDLFNGYSLAALLEHDDVCGVVPVNTDSFISERVLQIAQRISAGFPGPRNLYSHGLVGTFRAKEIFEFFDWLLSNFMEEVRTCDDRELTALVGILFDDFILPNKIVRPVSFDGFY